jgi:hypothetical protein
MSLYKGKELQPPEIAGPSWAYQLDSGRSRQNMKIIVLNMQLSFTCSYSLFLMY